MEFDFFTLFPLFVAAFIFWKLRSVLGTRNGTEKPPFEPYDPARKDRPADAKPDASGLEDNDNVVTLPNARGRRGTDVDTEPAVPASIDKVAGKDKTLKLGLTAIHSRDPNFEPNEFLAGAKIAYEMIVTAFADGDKRALKGLLARDVYENFEAEINARAKRNERIDASFVGIENANFMAAEVIKEEAQITLRFVSQMISATYNDADEVVDGDAHEVAEITDVWTFARPIKSRDPNWKLIATDA